MLPYKRHTTLTDNGIQFTNHKRHVYAFAHIFGRVCRENEIDHRLTKIKHTWTNGQVERMNRTIKEATVQPNNYDSHDQFRQNLADFINVYNFARRLTRSLTAHIVHTTSSNLLISLHCRPHSSLVLFRENECGCRKLRLFTRVFFIANFCA
jgi:Integrase core domain